MFKESNTKSDQEMTGIVGVYKDGLNTDPFGKKCWYQNNVPHRLDGPAVEMPNGTKKWFVNGDLHRLDGPAIEWCDGTKEYWYEGYLTPAFSLEEFQELVKIWIIEDVLNR